MRRVKKCNHPLKTKAIEQWEDADKINYYRRVWYCLKCKKVIEIIDDFVDSEASLDSFELQERS